jgi:hypothetical protein
VLAVFVNGLRIAKGGGLSAGDSVGLAGLAERPAYFRSGWSALEPTGLWSDGRRAVLVAPLAPPPSGDATLVFEGNAYLPHPGYVQHVIVSARGRPLAAWTFDSRSASGQRTLKIPASLIHDGQVELDFDLPDATSPAAQHVSADPRVLAYFMKSFSVAK